MSSFYVIPLVSALINFCLAAFVIRSKPRDKLFQAVALFNVNLGAWCLCAVPLYLVAHETALKWALVLAIVVAWALYCSVNLCLTLMRSVAPQTVGRLKRLFLIGPVVFSILPLVSELTIVHRQYAWFILPTPAFQAYMTLYTVAAIGCWIVLFREFKASVGLQRRRVFIVLIAIILVLLGGAHDVLLLNGVTAYPGTNVTVYPLGQLIACIYGMLIAYSALHSTILDARVALGRNIAVILRLAFFALISALVVVPLQLFLHPGVTLQEHILVLCAQVLALLISLKFFPKLLSDNSGYLERRLLGDRFEYEQQLLDFTQQMENYSSAEKLLEDTQELLFTRAKLTHVALATIDVSTQRLVHHMGLPEKPANEIINPSAPIFKLLHDKETPVLLELPEELAPFTVALRLGTQEVVTGVMLLSNKRNEEPYTKNDVLLLTHLTRALNASLDRLNLVVQRDQNAKHLLLSEMSRGLAHDLNNLLTPIATHLQTLDTTTMDELTLSVHRMSLFNAERIKTYIRESMFFAQNLRLHKVSLSASDLLQRAIGASEMRAAAAKVQLRLELTQDFILEVDPTQIERALSNLVNNAIDASPSGSDVVVIATYLPKTNVYQSVARFQVIDRGTGISEEHQARLFQPYFTTKDTGDTRRGFGLGLSVTQRIIQLHGGSISFTSSPGAGTTFQIDLPLS